MDKKKKNSAPIFGGEEELQRIIALLLHVQPQEKQFIEEVATSSLHINEKITLLRRMERRSTETPWVKVDYERFKKIEHA